MKSIVCPDCKKKSPFQEKYAGRKIKCSCGKIFPCSIDLEEKIDHSNSNCLNCNEELKPNWKSCPACGKDSHVFSIKNKNSNPEISPPTKNPIKAKNTSLNPIMNIVNDNVIKAEINASTNITNDNSVRVKGKYIENQSVNVDGDIVDKKEVINNFNETHIYKRETIWNFKYLKEERSRQKAEDVKLEFEFENAKKSNDELLSFALKLLTNLESTSHLDILLYKSTFQYRSGLCSQALALVDIKFANNLAVLKKSEEYKLILTKLIEKHKKNFLGNFLFLKDISPSTTSVIVGTLFLLFIIGLFFEQYNEYAFEFRKEEINKLIVDGKYKEAKIRLVSLGGYRSHQNNKNLIEIIEKAINTAEQNDNQKK